MKMKKLAVLSLAAALSLGTVMTASAAWVQDGQNWRYTKEDGTYQANMWFQDPESMAWYRFDANGAMVKGWYQDTDGKWYYLGANGAMVKGWHLDTNGKWYFMSYSGEMQTGLIKVSNAVYYMDASGALYEGEMTVNGITYTFGVNGTVGGAPYVGMDKTFGSNGSQSTGSGSSRSSSSGGSTSTSKNKLTTVHTLDELNAKAKEGYTNLKLDTKEEGAMTLAESADVEDYSKISLTVYAPNMTITNEIPFKQVTIEAIKANTWIEEASKRIILKGSATIDSRVTDLELRVEEAKIDVKLSGKKTYLKVEEPGANIVLSAPVKADVNKKVSFIFEESAFGEESTINVTGNNTILDLRSSNPKVESRPVNIFVSGTGATVQTGTPTKITTSQPMTLAITNSAAAKKIEVTSTDPTANSVEVINNSSVLAEVLVTKSDGTVTTVNKAEGGEADEYVTKGIQDAVKKANDSEYIDAALGIDNIITVTIKSNEKLVNALPVARTILNIFKSVEGVGFVWVDDEPVDSDEDMIRFARDILELKGNTTLGEIAEKQYQFEVRVGLMGEENSLTYSVVIK